MKSCKISFLFSFINFCLIVVHANLSNPMKLHPFNFKIGLAINEAIPFKISCHVQILSDLDVKEQEMKNYGSRM